MVCDRILTGPTTPQAVYARVRPDSPGTSKSFDAAADRMIDMVTKCGYTLPRLVISVTGGARDFELSKELQVVLRRGLRKVNPTATQRRFGSFHA